MTKFSRGLIVFVVAALIAAACATDTPDPPDTQIGSEVTPNNEPADPDTDPNADPDADQGPEEDPASDLVEDLPPDPDSLGVDPNTEPDAEPAAADAVGEPGPVGIELSLSDTRCNDQTDGSELDGAVDGRCLGSDGLTVEIWWNDQGVTVEVSDLAIEPGTDVTLFFAGEGPVAFQWKIDGTFDAFYGLGFENFTADPGTARLEADDHTVTLIDLPLTIDEGVVSIVNSGGTTLGGMEVPPGEHALQDFTVFIGTGETLNAFLFSPEQFGDAFESAP